MSIRQAIWLRNLIFLTMFGTIVAGGFILEAIIKKEYLWVITVPAFFAVFLIIPMRNRYNDYERRNPLYRRTHEFHRMTRIRNEVMRLRYALDNKQSTDPDYYNNGCDQVSGEIDKYLFDISTVFKLITEYSEDRRRQQLISEVEQKYPEFIQKWEKFLQDTEQRATPHETRNGAE